MKNITVVIIVALLTGFIMASPEKNMPDPNTKPGVYQAEFPGYIMDEIEKNIYDHGK